MLPEIDEVDREIIRQLQRNPRARYASLARSTSVSESTIRRRVESLIASGAIVTSVLVDLHMLGFRTSAIVGVHAHLESARQLGNRLAEFKEVTYVAVTTGRYDAVFHVAARTLDELYEFLAEKIAPLEGIKDIEVMVMPRMIKGMRDWRLPEEG